MKPTKIQKVPGTSLEDKIGYLLDQYKVLYVQEKLNGVGFRAWMTGTRLNLFTTRDKCWPAGFFGDVMEIELSMYLAAHAGTAFGEFFCPGIPLATLAGAISVNRTNGRDPAVPVTAVIYDVFDHNIPKAFSARFNHIGWAGKHPVKHIDTYQHTDPATVLKHYHDIVRAGGEGIIIRADPCWIGPGISPMMWKVKRLPDMEGTCFAVTEGKGKRKGMLGAFLLRLPDGNSVAVGGGTGLTDEQLTEYFLNPPIGKKITFSYEEMSINNIPLRCQFIAVRDYES
jgi:hypothetical protein